MTTLLTKQPILSLLAAFCFKKIITIAEIFIPQIQEISEEASSKICEICSDLRDKALYYVKSFTYPLESHQPIKPTLLLYDTAYCIAYVASPIGWCLTNRNIQPPILDTPTEISSYMSVNLN